jgi:hypothetical protein
MYLSISIYHALQLLALSRMPETRWFQGVEVGMCWAHGRMGFMTGGRDVYLFGSMAPVECAAAHGHVNATILLVQVSA